MLELPIKYAYNENIDKLKVEWDRRTDIDCVSLGVSRTRKTNSARNECVFESSGDGHPSIKRKARGRWELLSN